MKEVQHHHFSLFFPNFIHENNCIHWLPLQTTASFSVKLSQVAKNENTQTNKWRSDDVEEQNLNEQMNSYRINRN